MASKLQKNILYNIGYQLLNIALPLITVPYVSRTLGVESNGIYSYTYSIVNYFMIFAMLGISNYGSRRIAKIHDKQDKLSSEFTSIFIIQATLSLVAIFVYLIYGFCFARYHTITIIEVLFLISTLLDISWFYFGIEEFKTTTLRNSIVKVLSVILILMFVHTATDLHTYAFIMGGAALLSQIILWAGLKKHVALSIHGLSFKKIYSHLKGIVILFIPVISYSIYKIMDKIMLGSMYSIDEVAFYEYAERIINIPIGIISAIGTVMLPKMSNLISKNDDTSVKSYIYKSLETIMFMAIPCCLGIISISGSLTVILLGEEYQRTEIIMQFLSFTLLFTAWANVIRTQWLIPKEKDGIYIWSTIIGACLNFTINLLLIPKYGGIGASIGTICSEFLIMFIQSFLSRKSISFRKIIKNIFHFSISGIIMFILIISLTKICNNPVLQLIVQVAIGTISYSIMNLHFIRKSLVKKTVY